MRALIFCKNTGIVFNELHGPEVFIKRQANADQDVFIIEEDFDMRDGFDYFINDNQIVSVERPKADYNAAVPVIDADAWVDSNVKTLADVRTVLKSLLRASDARGAGHRGGNKHKPQV